jgi:hypothetical protein
MGIDIGDVVVATVATVSDRAATKGNPPRVQLEVHEVIRGDPKADRSRAVWKPMPHDIDYEDATSEARRQAWRAKPMTGPRVGSKWILAGQLLARHRHTRFHVFGWGRYPYSEQKRARVIQHLEEADRRRRAYEAEQEAKRKALAEAQAEWRAQTSDEDIRRYAAEADFVGIGKIVSEAPTVVSEGFSIAVHEILRGERRYQHADDSCFLEIAVDASVRRLLDRQTPYLVFLSEKGRRSATASRTIRASGSATGS